MQAIIKRRLILMATDIALCAARDDRSGAFPPRFIPGDISYLFEVRIICILQPLGRIFTVFFSEPFFDCLGSLCKIQPSHQEGQALISKKIEEAGYPRKRSHPQFSQASDAKRTSRFCNDPASRAVSFSK
jgi:hypothetical protein